MGFVEWVKRLFGRRDPFAEVDFRHRRRRRPPERPELGLMDLSRRLAKSVTELQATPVRYEEFTIPKRSGGRRTILAPCPQLKQLQRRILRRLLGRLRAHPAATGFERGRSIVTNAAPHVGAAVVVRMDIHDFFPSTATHRVRAYLTGIGWSSEAVYLLLRWTTCDGGLPQGAPTSPRLSNLVNYLMDARLAGLAARLGAVYTRYADDITFSFGADDRCAAAVAVRATKRIVDDYGYRLHLKQKLSVRRRHQSQRVTGLIVNERVALPRESRRRLRAIRHHIETDRPATLTPRQLAGWDALSRMIEEQRAQ